MEAQYTWLSIGNSSGESRGGHVARGTGAIVEIMGALINNPSVFADEIQDKIWSGVTLCIGGEMKSSGEGKPASNFRYEKDLTLNSTVVANFVYLFDWHKKMNDSKPIFITTIPRQMRDYSWFIKEDGTMIRKDQKWRRRAENPSDPVSHHGFPGGEDALDKEDDVFMIFLSANCVEKEQMVKIRECCKGARYHTYLVDMLSFLYQLRCNDKDFTSTFKPEYRVLQVDNDGTKDQLYFNHSMDSSGYVFMCPKWESVMVIYQDLYEAPFCLMSHNTNSDPILIMPTKPRKRPLKCIGMILPACHHDYLPKPSLKKKDKNYSPASHKMILLVITQA